MKKLFLFAMLITGSLSAYAQYQGTQQITLQAGASAMVTVYQPTQVTCVNQSPGNGLIKSCSCEYARAGEIVAFQYLHDANGVQKLRREIVRLKTYEECARFITTSPQCTPTM